MKAAKIEQLLNGVIAIKGEASGSHALIHKAELLKKSGSFPSGKYTGREIPKGTTVALKSAKMPTTINIQGINTEEKILRLIGNIPEVIGYHGTISFPKEKVIVLDWAESTLLEEVYDSDSNLSEAVIDSHTKRICKGASKLHKFKAPNGEGFLNRDFKPENILIHNGLSFIGDFSCAGTSEGKASYNSLLSSNAHGNHLYAAPESLPAGADSRCRFSTQSELYSIALLSLYMAEGEIPFENEKLIDDQEDMLSAKLGPHLGVDWRDFVRGSRLQEHKRKAIEKALDPNLQIRYKTVDQFLNDFLPSGSENPLEEYHQRISSGLSTPDRSLYGTTTPSNIDIIVQNLEDAERFCSRKGIPKTEFRPLRETVDSRYTTDYAALSAYLDELQEKGEGIESGTIRDIKQICTLYGNGFGQVDKNQMTAKKRVPLNKQ